ncbi:MAG: hypothetical protein P1V51_17195 [Deltaproteobacteria bacterium]|nr:hypothetical protein [Deltaproteobacteria bacterium]
MSDALVPFEPKGGLTRARASGPPARYVSRALVHPANIGAVAAVVGAVTVLGSPLLLAAGIALELAYLAIVPRLGVFRAAVDGQRQQKRREDREQAEQEVYEGLSANQQQTYDALKALREGIQKNYKRFGRGMPAMASQSMVQIDVLLSSFLRLLDQLNAYRRHLGATGQVSLERELEELKRDLETEENPRLREIKERRVRIMGQRLERYARGEENREVISHQLAAIEDLLRLVHEQSLTLRDPADVSHHLDSLVAEVEETENTVREMEDFLHIQDEIEAIDRLGGG